MKILITILFCSISLVGNGQAKRELIIQGNYSKQDSIEITEAYEVAWKAVGLMHDMMNSVWHIGKDQKDQKHSVRTDNWIKNEFLMTWLGKPNGIKRAHRRIRKIQSKFQGKMIFHVAKENKGRCYGWISAWTIPFGQTKIRLCEDYFIYRTHLQEKIIIHEVGHEVGMFSHKRIHGCRAARRAATAKRNVATRSPENYAWLAMSILGLECAY